MNVRIQKQDVLKISGDLLVVPLEREGHKGTVVQALDAALHGTLKEQIARSGFSGKDGETLICPTQGQLPSRVLLLVGLGKADSIDTGTWRRGAGKVHREAKSQGAKQVAWFFSNGSASPDVCGAVVEGTLLSGYVFEKYKSEKNGKPGIDTLTFVGPELQSSSAVAQAVNTAQKVIPGVFLARDLINEPASVSTPSYLADTAAKLLRGKGLKGEIWGPAKIKAAKMSGLLAVARGSLEEPRFIKLSYTPTGKAKKKIALVGKGLTFDSGGLSLKPPKSMETMKHDMSGGATVLGVMSVIAQLKPQVQVTGYVPATENMPSGTAQKPGDIIRYSNGKTVEVLNTDAEGRLILADALINAVQDKPDVIIDLATLTGACIIALGGQVAGLFSNNDELAETLMNCSKETGEPLWRLPLVKEYKDDIKSSIADIKNTGGGNAGAIAAALFLQEFVGDVPWAHLDIAGPAFTEKESAYTPKGGTGFGVRTLVRYLIDL
ncbi:MAG: leucyl aminopeptidase [Candidatus Binatia bacterium]